MDNNEFLKNLLLTFREEADEHLKTISSGLVALEKTKTNKKRAEIIEEIFRAAHSLKGAAHAVNLVKIETLCHAAENIFSALKKNQVAPSSPLINLLHETIDAIQSLLLETDNHQDKIDEVSIAGIIQQLKTVLIREPDTTSPPDKLNPANFKKKDGPNHLSTTAPTKPVSSVKREKRSILPQNKFAPANTLRISTEKLNALLFQIEELLTIKLVAAQRTVDINEALKEILLLKKKQVQFMPATKFLHKNQSKSEKHLQSHTEDAHFDNILRFIVCEAEFVKSLEEKLRFLAKDALQEKRSLYSKLDGLLEDMKKALMQPISTMLQLFPKLVRDISYAQGKEIELIISGAEAEIDRRILEEIYDPLMHMVRNCIDHGIESPEVREKKNKPRKGTIRIIIKQRENSQIKILISDDGSGIDRKTICKKAREKGLIPQNDEGSEQEWVNYIFQSGVSSSPVITELSGRGLGLAIVSEKIEKLGGTISVESKSNIGTRFHLVLPLTLATFRGVYVRVNEEQFLIPTAQIEQCLRLQIKCIKTIEGREIIPWQGETVALVSLANVLELPRQPKKNLSENFVHIIILGSAGKRIAFYVDEIINEDEVLIKNLNTPLVRVRNISGVTLLANGKPVPVLNIADLLKSAIKMNNGAGFLTDDTKSIAIEKKSILIVEDSITSRNLLKNIFESAGFSVVTAVDGLEAFNLLKTRSFDLVLSDVIMPKMNGFELTEKIRADRAYADLPVVLITSLASSEDHQRGADVGANAFIVKSNFNQSNLLETVRRLI